MTTPQRGTTSVSKSPIKVHPIRQFLVIVLAITIAFGVVLTSSYIVSEAVSNEASPSAHTPAPYVAPSTATTALNRDDSSESPIERTDASNAIPRNGQRVEQETVREPSPKAEVESRPTRMCVHAYQVDSSKKEPADRDIHSAVVKKLQDQGYAIVETEEHASAICEFAVGSSGVNSDGSVSFWSATTIWSKRDTLLAAGTEERTSVGQGMTPSARMEALISARSSPEKPSFDILWPHIQFFSPKTTTDTEGLVPILTIDRKLYEKHHRNAWFLTRSRRPQGSLFVRWISFSRASAGFQAAVYRAIDEAEWRVCRSPESADIVLEVSMNETVGEATYTGFGGGRLPTYDYAVGFRVLDSNTKRNRPLQEWKIRGATQPFVDAMEGTRAQALRILCNEFSDTTRAFHETLSRFKLQQSDAPIATIPDNRDSAPKNSFDEEAAKDRERTATDKLRLAKLLLKTRPTAARERLAEIVKTFDGTEAAREAASLLMEQR